MLGRHGDVPFEGEGEASKLAAAATLQVVPLLRTVVLLKRVVTLRVQSYGRGFKVGRDLFSLWMVGLAKKGWGASLEQLVLVDFDWRGNQGATDRPLPLAIQPRDIIIQRSKLTRKSLRRLIPANAEHLRSFALETVDTHLTPSALTSLVTLLPSSLHSLSLKCTDSQGDPERYIHDYPFEHLTFTLRPIPSLSLFSSLPNLQSLTLGGVRGLTLASIATLATSSPHLRTLLLTNSVWAFPNNTLDEHALADLLAPPNWPDLTAVNLGVLPLEEYGPGPTLLAEVCRSRGVQLVYELCEEEGEEEDSKGYCEECGGDGCRVCYMENYLRELAADGGLDDPCERCGGEFCARECVD